MINLKKIGIVGAGHVGSHCALTMMLEGVCDEITFVDVDNKKACAQALDCMDTISNLPHKIVVTSGNLENLGDKDIIIISVGTIDNVSQNRLGETKLSLELIKSIIPQIMNTGFEGYFIVITNPVDIITYYVQYLSKLPYNRVIGSGTSLDSGRFKRILSDELSINPKSITAFMLGEHGDSQVAAFSNVFLEGKRLDDYLNDNPEKNRDFDHSQVEKKVIESGWDIYQGKGSTEFGIGSMCSEIVKSIYHDKKNIIACGAYLDGQYGYKGVYAGVPVIIGKNGIEGIIELPLDNLEKSRLLNSFEILKKYIEFGRDAIVI